MNSVLHRVWKRFLHADWYGLWSCWLHVMTSASRNSRWEEEIHPWEPPKSSLWYHKRDGPDIQWHWFLPQYPYLNLQPHSSLSPPAPSYTPLFLSPHYPSQWSNFRDANANSWEFSDPIYCENRCKLFVRFHGPISSCVWHQNQTEPLSPIKTEGLSMTLQSIDNPYWMLQSAIWGRNNL